MRSGEQYLPVPTSRLAFFSAMTSSKLLISTGLGGSLVWRRNLKFKAKFESGPPK